MRRLISIALCGGLVTATSGGEGCVRLSFTGDIMMQKEQILSAEKFGSDSRYDFMVSSVASVFTNSDYVVGALETPVAGGGARLTYERMRFNAPPAFLCTLRRLGVNMVTLANNHITDRGVDGIISTIRNVRECGLDSVGAYDDPDSTEQILIKTIKGVRVAFLACTYDVNVPVLSDEALTERDWWRVDFVCKPSPFSFSYKRAAKYYLAGMVPDAIKDRVRRYRRRNVTASEGYCLDSIPASLIDSEVNRPFQERFLSRVGRARHMADVVVVLPHIGGQWSRTPGEWTLDMMRKIVQAGADVVVANHSHCPQQFVRYPNGSVGFTALGDFVHVPDPDAKHDPRCDYSLVFHVDVDALSKRIVACCCDETRSVFRDDGSACAVLTGVHDSADKYLRIP